MVDPGQVLDLLCGNDPSRAMHGLDAPTGACARCCGLYLGAALALASSWFARGRVRARPVGLLALGVLVNVLEIAAEQVGVGVGAFSRLVVGAVLGLALGAWLARARAGRRESASVAGIGLGVCALGYGQDTVASVDLGLVACALATWVAALRAALAAAWTATALRIVDVGVCGALVAWSVACGGSKSTATAAPSEASAREDPIPALIEQLRKGAVEPSQFEAACGRIGGERAGVYANRPAFVQEDCAGLARAMWGSVQTCPTGAVIGECAGRAIEQAHADNLARYASTAGGQPSSESASAAKTDSTWLDHAQPQPK